MKLFRFYYKQQVKENIGLALDDQLIDLHLAAESWGIKLPETIKELIQNEHTMMKSLKEVLAEKNAEDLSAFSFSKEAIHFLPVVNESEKIFCLVFNYPQHAIDYGVEIPTDPIWLNMFNNTLSAHEQDIPLPINANQIDYEGELVVVIGKQAKFITPEQAKDVIFGYTIGNDLSARDIQHRSSQWALGKTLDYFSPTGPFIVTSDSIENPNDLHITLTVNGEVRQSENTKHMILTVEELISYLSQYVTLEPGDLIFTGTPKGTVAGRNQHNYDWLKSGDIVEVSIDQLGLLRNRLV